MNEEVLNMTMEKEIEGEYKENSAEKPDEKAEPAGCCCSGGADSAAVVSNGSEDGSPAEQAENDVCCCSGKHKIRSGKEKRDLMNRLKRIEGQVRGLQNMLERDAYCPDILVQASAVNAAINSFSRVLLTSHIRTCVADNIREGNDEVIDELAATLQKMMK